MRRLRSACRLEGAIKTAEGVTLASFPGSCAGEEEREPGTHCSHMRQIPLVTCILLRYTEITVNFCLPSERLHCLVILPVGYTYTGGFKVKNNIALTVTVCTASFEAIGKLQRERLHQSRATAFSWNGQTRGQFLQAKS